MSKHRQISTPWPPVGITKVVHISPFILAPVRVLTLVNVWAALARSPQLVSRETGAGERAYTVGADGVGAAGCWILTLIDIKAAFRETNATENQIHLCTFETCVSDPGLKVASDASTLVGANVVAAVSVGATVGQSFYSMPDTDTKCPFPMLRHPSTNLESSHSLISMHPIQVTFCYTSSSQELQ